MAELARVSRRRRRGAPLLRLIYKSPWEATMPIYSCPIFDMAVNRSGGIADRLPIPTDERDRLGRGVRGVTGSGVTPEVWSFGGRW
jgi:hypothetical protein